MAKDEAPSTPIPPTAPAPTAWTASTDRPGRPADGRRRIAMVAFPSIQLLDVVGPLEVFAAADLAARERGIGAGYAIEIVGPEGGGMLRASSGLGIAVDRSYAAPSPPVDTLIVAGGSGSRAAADDPRVLEHVRRVAREARRVCSVCTGAWVLASAGLLEGRRVTTHWAHAERLARHFPGLEVDPDRLHVRDGRIWTSAGVTAGMDLALALVEEDLGRELALEVSRWMVLFMKRPGGQSQFSAQLSGQLAARDPLRDLQASIVDHPEADHSIEAMAARVAMSPRHFMRVFREEVGQSPGRFVECVRVEAARRALEESRRSIEEIASQVGFGTGETMRRAFLRQIGVGPAAYRERFAEAAADRVA
ncbi:MAG TPA: GlxA family transcriptional regulator [Deltaproteobacteria bacterium]|nr:GlxA family transcriptional regulator [Deltaproteobacteria bacterium]